VLERIAADEERHARLFERRLREAGLDPGPCRPTMRAKLLAGLAERFGRAVVVPTMRERERLGAGAYEAAGGTDLAAEEREHERLLVELGGDRRGEPVGRALTALEKGHRGGGNALRAAVMGVNDGLVSNLSLVMGVAGAGVASSDILLRGIAGLIAGAGSMAMGEWISVTSSRELYERELAVERAEIREHPEEERAELQLVYEQKGLHPARAAELAEAIMQDEEVALETLAREELGIDPQELGGSAWVAAAMSFVLFVVGAIVPVVPFVFLDGNAAVATALAASVVALFLIGAAITLFTGRSPLVSGARQLAFGLGAAAATYGVGTLFGVAIG
jgi:VIT1/CCC1 family predicted Fe2+/Mn2+ transporter